MRSMRRDRQHCITLHRRAMSRWADCSSTEERMYVLARPRLISQKMQSNLRSMQRIGRRSSLYTEQPQPALMLSYSFS